MQQKTQKLIRVFIKGGILSPKDLLIVMDVSRKMGNKYISFGEES